MSQVRQLVLCPAVSCDVCVCMQCVSAVDLAVCRNPVTFSRTVPSGTHTLVSVTQSHSPSYPKNTFLLPSVHYVIGVVVEAVEDLDFCLKFCI